MSPDRQLRGAHNYRLNRGLNRLHRLHGLLPRCSIGSDNADTVSDHSASRKNTETGYARDGTGKSSLVHLAPVGRYVYSTWDNKIPQAPAGRHVCRIRWMPDKLVVEYGNSTYRLPSNLGKIIAQLSYRTDKKVLNRCGNY